MTTPRTLTPVDAIADAHLAESARLSPMEATTTGIVGHDDALDDLSPDGHAERADLYRGTLRSLANATPADDTDVVTIAAMRERLHLDIERYEAGEPLADLNNVASPLQSVRDVFDLMPTATLDHWHTIAQRLAAIPQALAGYRASLAYSAAKGLAPARRQVEIGVGQARDLAKSGSFFDTFAASPTTPAPTTPTPAHDDVPPLTLPSSLQHDLTQAATRAREAYAETADFLARELAPHAPEADAVGRDRYALASRFHIGAEVDLEETYQWGLEQLNQINQEMREVAAAIVRPGASLDEAQASLDRDPARRLRGPKALEEWMTEVSQEAMEALADVHFNIPEPARRLECLVAPTHTGVIYYTGPSEDFSRPGRMWWSIPEGVTELTTWKERTTVYHEGVPGHHLQVATTTYRAAELNRWRRLGCWVSGTGEGWALYAERLMDELGFLADPGDRFGMLDSQRLRAARVVFDIGLHLGLSCPGEWGGGRWDAAKGWDFLRANYSADDGFIRFELERYLGWPGQAPSYKVGQRLWEAARDAARARAGSAFSLKDFHDRALALGSVGLDVLAAALG
ncbi:MAG: DUF885 domain-containing protein [Micrococcales bacterium]|nr:DUF885 domain-containing protein [Micrococcales bacterium]